MSSVIIERVNAHKIKCNDNNNPIDADDKESHAEQYAEIISKTHLHRYKDLINYPVAFTYDLTETEVGILIETIPTSYVTGRPDSRFVEEIDCILQRMEKEIGEKWKESPTGWFARMTDCSGKDGYKKFPLLTLKDFLEQIGSSRRILIALLNGSRTFYFVPYDSTWEECRELRVFVKKGRMTAVSQYVWFKFALFSCMDDKELTNLALDLDEYLKTTLPPILEKLEIQDVVVDIYWNEDGTFKIIEFNSYGYWLAAGAALFSWMNDRDKLYGKTDNIYFRVHE
jgi:hypothetical protein